MTHQRHANDASPGAPRRVRRTRHRAAGVAAALVMLVGVVAVTTLATPERASAQASPGDVEATPVSGTVTASLNVGAEAFDVTWELTLRNNTQNIQWGGWAIAVPTDVTDVRTFAGGQQRPFERESGNPLMDFVDFEFGRWVDPGQTIDFRVEGSKPIHAGIVNAAYVDVPFTFVTEFSAADTDSTLVVEFPPGFEVSATGDFDAPRGDGRPSTSTSLGQGSPVVSSFEATRDSELVRENIDVGEVSARVAGWPGQQEWMSNTTGVVEASLQALTDVSGRDLPEANVRVVRRNINDVNVRPNGTIELGGGDLDPRLLIERLAPQMFDGEMDTPWINAGLAATYAELAFAEVEGGEPAVAAPSGGEPLNSWTPDEDGLQWPSSPADEEAWDSSWYVISSLYDELGADGLTEILDAASTGESPYPSVNSTSGSDEDEATANEDDENGADEEPSVDSVPEGQAEDFAPRQDDGGDGNDAEDGNDEDGADGGSDDGADAGGDGDTGSGGDTEEWQRLLDHAENSGSTTATDVFREAVVTDDQAGLLDERLEARAGYDELVEASDAWETPAVIRDSMTSWDFGTATSELGIAHEVLDRAAVLEEDTFALAIDAPSIQSDYESATDSLEPVLASTEDALTATGPLLNAQDAADADRGFVEGIGLMGNDLDGMLDDAKASFEAGEFGQAIAQADDVVETADGASGAGMQRLLIGLLVLVLIVGLVVFLVVRKRRRRSSDGPRTGDEASEPIEAPAGAAVGTANAPGGFMPPTEPGAIDRPPPIGGSTPPSGEVPMPGQRPPSTENAMPPPPSPHSPPPGQNPPTAEMPSPPDRPPQD